MKAAWVAYVAAASGLALGAGWAQVDAGLPRSAVRIATLVPDALSPSTVYAVGEAAFGSGSLFKSTDGGATWKISGGVSGVTSLAVDPGDSSTLYVIAHGAVLKSVDGGQSWGNASAGVFSASSLAIDPQNGSVLYAAAHGSLFKTTDGAATWQALGAPSPLPCCMQLAIDPSASSTIYVNIGVGLLKSVDGGASWRTLLSTQGLCNCPLTIDPTHPSTIYASFLESPPGQWNLHKSTDGGETWSLANAGIPAGAFVTSLTVDPTLGTLYASYLVGDPTGGVVKSADGAASWSTVGLRPNSPPVYSLALNPKDPSTILAGYFDPSTGRGGVFRTTDAGANWDDASAGLAVLDVHGLAADPTNPSTLYVAAGDGVSKSLDGGANWTTVHFNAPDLPDLHGTAVITSLLNDPNNSNVLYASVLNTAGCFYSEGFLRKSLDAGATWIDLPVSSCAFGPTVLFAAVPNDSNTLYAAPEDVADCGTPLDTTNDGGATWNTTYINGFVTALVADPGHPATLYAAYNQGFFKSADGGKHWAATALTNVNVSALALDPANPSILYAGGAAASPDGALVLSKSTDGGATWSAITAGLEPVMAARSPITALAIDSEHSVLYLGASGSGVFKSVDGGATWAVFSEGLSNLDILALAVSSDGTVYAGAGDGVFRSLGKASLRSLPRR